MCKSRCTEVQIVRILKESESGTQTEEIIRKYGVSRNTFYRWRQKYSGMEVDDVRRLRRLEAENREQVAVNRKRVLRIYRELGLQVRGKKRRQVARIAELASIGYATDSNDRAQVMVTGRSP